MISYQNNTKRHASETPFFILAPTVREKLLSADLTAAEWRIWCYLASLDPFGDRGVKFSTAQVMVKCGVKRTAYFGAKAKFQKLGFFDFKDGETKVFNLQGYSLRSKSPNHSQEAQVNDCQQPGVNDCQQPGVNDCQQAQVNDCQQAGLNESGIADSQSGIADSQSGIADSQSGIADSQSGIADSGIYNDRACAKTCPDSSDFSHSPDRGQGEKEEEMLTAKGKVSNTAVPEKPDLSNSRIQENKASGKDKFSGAARQVETQTNYMADEVSPKHEPAQEVEAPSKPKPVKKVKARKYDSALAINPPPAQKNLQQRHSSWLEDGPWMIDGKLDPNFLDWLAKKWMKRYGGTIHEKRADVLLHFKKDIENLKIQWEQYNKEYLARYENAATRMEHGVRIKESEQQKLIEHSNAITKPLPEEMSVVAPKQQMPAGLTAAENQQPVLLPSKAEEAQPETIQVEASSVTSYQFPVPSRGGVTPPLQPDSDGVAHSELVDLTENPVTGNCSLVTEKEAPQQAKTDDSWKSNIPVHEDGTVENPMAYRPYQPEELEGDPITPEQFKELRASLAQLTEKMSMPKPKKGERKASLTKLEKLNQWLADPICREEAILQVENNGFYSLEYDEYGNPFQVVLADPEQVDSEQPDRSRMSNLYRSQVQARKEQQGQVEDSPVQATQEQPAQVQDSQVQVTQEQSAQVQGSSVQDHQEQPAQVQSSPVQASQAQPTQVQESSAQPIQAQSSQLEHSSVQDSPVQTNQAPSHQKQPCEAQSQETLEQLNIWLHGTQDERNKAVRIVFDSDRYTIECDDLGQFRSVVEVKE